jgi:hypothetical protein
MTTKKKGNSATLDRSTLGDGRMGRGGGGGFMLSVDIRHSLKTGTLYDFTNSMTG